MGAVFFAKLEMLHGIRSLRSQVEEPDAELFCFATRAGSHLVFFFLSLLLDAPGGIFQFSRGIHGAMGLSRLISALELWLYLFHAESDIRYPHSYLSATDNKIFLFLHNPTGSSVALCSKGPFLFSLML
jgi:hypothetical protein